MPSASASTASSPPGSSKMKQSVLSFKPRVSSGLASGPSTPNDSLRPPIEPIEISDIEMADGDDQTRGQDSDEEMTTPPANGEEFSTPPAASTPKGTSSSRMQADSDDDDDDLSDPPPLAKSASSTTSKPKVLTKKRHSLVANSPNASGSSSSSSRYTPVGPKVPKENGEMRKTALPGEGPLCHQHRALCATEQIRCTYMRKPTVRCGLKFCAAALSVQYNDDLDAIKARGRNVPGIGLAEHCDESEANYIFKCPRCLGICTCSICRKKFGVEPVRVEKPPAAPKQKAPAKSKAKASTSDVKGKAKASSSSSSSAGASGANGSQSKKAAAAPSGAAKAKGKKATSSLKNALTSKAQALPSTSKPRQATLPRPIKPPAPVAAPELEVIKTALHPENVWARMWIYETLVRFDFIRVPKGQLIQLDKFDLWTHRQVQTLLERILVALAGINSINQGQPKARVAPAIKAFRQFGEDLQRGEPWQAARDLLDSLGFDIPELPHVERVFSDESKEAAMRDADDSGPTLLSSRMTRTKRAAEVRALERVKQQSLYSYESQFSDQDESSEEDELEPARNGDRDEWAGDAESEEDEMPRRGGRSSARQATRAAPAAEGTRRSGRQTGATKAGTSASRSSRRIVIVNGSSNGSSRSGTSSTLTDSESGGSDDDDTGADDTRTSTTTPPPSTTTAPAPPKPAEPLPAPEMEEKVAILCVLLEAVLQTPEVSEELKSGAARMGDIDRAAREDLKQLEKEWEEEKKVLAAAAPSMAKVDDFAKWKKDKDKKERNHKLRVLDVKMQALRESEANKIRTGPLGTDADGRTYWQLTEFNEVMPRDTHGRWAWCVVVHGEPLVKDAPPQEAMPGTASNVSPVKPTMAAQTGDGEKQEVENSLDFKTEGRGTRFNGKARSPIVLIEQPDEGKSKDKDKSQRAASSSSTSSSTSDLTPPPPAMPAGPVFMGTNYPPSIKQVIAFLRYRAAQKDYEENKAQQDAEIAVAQQKASGGAGGSTSPTKNGDSSATALVSRKAKKQLKETQEARKAQVEALCKRLETVRWYYLWHTGEPDDDVDLSGKTEEVAK